MFDRLLDQVADVEDSIPVRIAVEVENGHAKTITLGEFRKFYFDVGLSTDILKIVRNTVDGYLKGEKGKGALSILPGLISATLKELDKVTQEN